MLIKVVNIVQKLQIGADSFQFQKLKQEWIMKKL